jgi:hypothetical protein
MSVHIEKASRKQVGAVIDLMFADISSDPSGMESLKNNWWQRTLFRHLIGPRMLQGQMETFVATEEPGSTDLLGYFVLQFQGETAGTFDWALANALWNGNPPDERDLEALAGLLGKALDAAEVRQHYPYFYFGLMSNIAPAVGEVLEEEGLWLPDYQLTQMVAPLPLEENPSAPDELRISGQLPNRMADRVLDLLRCDYVKPDALSEEDFEEDLEAIGVLHESTLRSAKIYLIKEGEEGAGFVQQHQWRDELRLLIALKPHLWGTDNERQLVAALPGLLGENMRRLRLRTFSQQHMDASRAKFESLGLKWEESPWQRWMVAL